MRGGAEGEGDGGVLKSVELIRLPVRSLRFFLVYTILRESV